MNDGATPRAPEWVTKRDGRLVPFEADKISRALFAAGERLGRPDAFLARELADGVVFFLQSETEGNPPTTAQIADQVVKVVRELGQPGLAHAFEEGRRHRQQERAAQPVASEETADEMDPRSSGEESFATVVQTCKRDFSLREVFARDLVAAQGDGLLTLMGLETPEELAGRALERLSQDNRILESILDSRGVVGTCLALDGPEFALEQYFHGLLVETREIRDSQVSAFCSCLSWGLRAGHLRAVVNVNGRTPPAWAGDLASGPLFADLLRRPDPQRLAQLSAAFLGGVAAAASSKPVNSLRLDWHLSERDFAGEDRDRLIHVAGLALQGAPVAFVFDRPRQPVSLGEGLNRWHPAVLMAVGLHLPRLAEQQGVWNDPPRFLKKLESLARLALSAAVQKRDFLRRCGQNRPALLQGFLLGRARLVVAPVGLETLVRTMTGEDLCRNAGLTLAKQIVQRLDTVLKQDGLASRLETCLDSPLTGLFRVAGPVYTKGRHFGFELPNLEDVAGLTAWNEAASPKDQLQAAGILHGLTGGGTAAILLAEAAQPSAEDLVEWLHGAWHNTDVNRVQVLRKVLQPVQPSLAMGPR